MKVGIIGAMDEEIKPFLRGMGRAGRSTHATMTFCSGTLSGSEVVVVKSGVGKVNAAVCAQLLISGFNVSRIIFTGVAGALDKRLDIGDIVVSSDCVQHDVNAEALGYERGRILFSNLRFFRADAAMAKAVLSAAKALNVKCTSGRILTGDTFITDSSESERLKKKLGGACIEMEGAAVAHACTLNRVPFVIIRTISDRADHSAPVDFKRFLPKAAQASAQLIRETLKRLNAR